MPKCKNTDKHSYKGTEPSPKGLGICSQTLKEGTKKKGKDGNIWIVKKIKNGTLRWTKFKNLEAFKIVDVTLDNLKKYKLEPDLNSIKFELSMILKNKERQGVFLIKNNVIIGFYHLLLKPILQLVFITISEKYRGQKLCNKLSEYLANFITKNDIHILKIVNAGGESALKCYQYCAKKLKYDILYKNKKDKWKEIDKEEMMTQGKKMIKKDDWMEILFINPNHNISEFESMVN